MAAPSRDELRTPTLGHRGFAVGWAVRADPFVPPTAARFDTRRRARHVQAIVPRVAVYVVAATPTGVDSNGVVAPPCTNEVVRPVPRDPIGSLATFDPSVAHTTRADVVFPASCPEHQRSVDGATVERHEEVATKPHSLRIIDLPDVVVAGPAGDPEAVIAKRIAIPNLRPRALRKTRPLNPDRIVVVRIGSEVNHRTHIAGGILESSKLGICITSDEMCRR